MTAGGGASLLAAIRVYNIQESPKTYFVATDIALFKIT